MPNTSHTSISGPDGALTHIRNFINGTLTGWTLHRDLTSPPGGEDSAGGRELAASKGDVLFGLRSTTAGTSSGNLWLFDGAGSWSAGNLDEMVGNSGVRVTDAQYDDTAASFTTGHRYWNEVGGTWPNLWIYGQDSSPSSFVHVVAEVEADVFYHLWIGELLKYGTWTGGAYYATQFWNRNASIIDQPDSSSHAVPFDGRAHTTTPLATTIHCSISDSPSGDWISGRSSDNVLNSVQRKAGMFSPLRGQWGVDKWRPDPSPLSGQAILQRPEAWYREVGTTPDEFHPLGYVPNVRVLNMRNLAPGEVITLGGDDWKVFPLSRYLGPDAGNNSGVHGIAYLVE